MADNQTTDDCRVKEGHRYDERGVCVWCDAERKQASYALYRKTYTDACQREFHKIQSTITR